MCTLCEELGVALDELARHGGAGQLVERVPPVGLIRADLDLLDLVDRHRRRSPQALNDDLRADTALDVLLDLLQNLAGQDDHRGCAVSYFGVLRPRNVDEDPGSRVDNVQKLPKVRTWLDISGISSLRTFMTVAQSLVMVCLPFASTINKSPP
jgi:hypothetical protein